MEVREVDGSEYPSKTLYAIMAGILRHLRESGDADMNFLQEDDLR